MAAAHQRSVGLGVCAFHIVEGQGRAVARVAAVRAAAVRVVTARVAAARVAARVVASYIEVRCVV